MSVFVLAETLALSGQQQQSEPEVPARVCGRGYSDFNTTSRVSSHRTKMKRYGEFVCGVRIGVFSCAFLRVESFVGDDIGA